VTGRQGEDRRRQYRASSSHDRPARTLFPLVYCDAISTARTGAKGWPIGQLPGRQDVSIELISHVRFRRGRLRLRERSLGISS
jgi:hypothetical protein